MQGIKFPITQENKAELLAICANLQKFDNTFVYEVKISRVVFEDEDNKRAFRRAMWIKRRLLEHGIKTNFRAYKRD